MFYFNTSQVNLTFDWTLNQPWALEFGHHWGMRARVVRGTNYSVYKCWNGWIRTLHAEWLWAKEKKCWLK